MMPAFSSLEGGTSQSGPPRVLHTFPDTEFENLVQRPTDHRDEEAFLVLDEMNRGNLPRVFGELYMALEYRDRPVGLMYSPEEEFEFLRSIGTMNTADRSQLVQRATATEWPPRSLGRHGKQGEILRVDHRDTYV